MNFADFAQRECPAVAQAQVAPVVSLAVPVVDLPQWQDDLCRLHAAFTETTGHCDRPDCFCEAIIDAGGELDKLKDYDIGHGVTCGHVIERMNQSSCPEDRGELIKFPAMFVLIAQAMEPERSQTK